MNHKINIKFFKNVFKERINFGNKDIFKIFRQLVFQFVAMVTPWGARRAGLVGL